MSEESARAHACCKEAIQTRGECDEAHCDALEALEEARDAVAAEERSQVQRAQSAAEWAQLEREQAEAERERAEGAARIEKRLAELAELAELRTLCTEMQRAGRWPPERAWGANWQTPPAECKVVSLVGVSPAGMRSLGEQAGVAACDRSRIVSSSLQPDGSTVMQLV